MSGSNIVSVTNLVPSCSPAHLADVPFALLHAAAHIEVDPELLSTEANRPPPGESSNPISSTLGAQGSSNRPSKKRKHLLSASTDPLFGELRDSNFSIVGAKLARLARRLEADYQGKNSLDTVGKMKEFVGKLGGLQGEQRALKLREQGRLCSRCGRFEQVD
jgi:hypothetical protein